ncbi:hypothetical protein EVB91_162 [Rhizobium phage RHph_I1_18]|nr:hypothetical protein EVB91_162 [Rhizobium phage RHph_I1_18]
MSPETKPKRGRKVTTKRPESARTQPVTAVAMSVEPYWKREYDRCTCGMCTGINWMKWYR